MPFLPYILCSFSSLNKVQLSDNPENAEFVLQVALYARRSLNIRTAANFILAVACTLENTKQYIKKYYDSMTITPSDWIEMAQLNRAINFANMHNISNSLRKVMVDKFNKFDEYQLQKHNKSGKVKKSEIVEIEDMRDIYEIRGPDKLTLKSVVYGFVGLVQNTQVPFSQTAITSLLNKTYQITFVL